MCVLDAIVVPYAAKEKVITPLRQVWTQVESSLVAFSRRGHVVDVRHRGVVWSKWVRPRGGREKDWNWVSTVYRLQATKVAQTFTEKSSCF